MVSMGVNKLQIELSNTFFTNSPLGICVLDEKGTILDVNIQLIKILKERSKKSLIGKNVFSIVADSYKKQAVKIFKRFIKTGVSDFEEIKVQLSNKSEIWVECKRVLYKDKKNSRKFIIQYIKNIDYAKNSELELLAVNNKLSKLYENLNIGLYRTTLKGKMVFANKAFAKVFGFKSFKDIQNLNINDLSKKSNYPRTKFLKMIKQKRKVLGYEVEIKLETGKVKCIRENAQGIFDARNNLIGIEGSIEDITEKVVTHSKLIESEESYRGLFNSIREAVYIQDQTGKFLDVNDGAVKMYGYPRSSFINNTPAFLSAPNKNDFLKLSSQIERAFKGVPQEFEFWGKKKNGQIFPKQVRLYKTKYFGKEAIIALAQDISEKKDFIEKLKQSEIQYKKLFENNPNPMWIYNQETLKFLNVNDAAINHYGYSKKEFLSMTIQDIRPKEDFNNLLEDVKDAREGFSLPKVWRHIKKNGEIILVEISAHSLDYFGYNAGLILLRDVTEQFKYSEQNRKLFEAVEQSSAMVLITDSNGNLEYVNKKFTEVTGYSKNEVLGKNPSILRYGINQQNEKKDLWQTLSNGDIWKGEFINRKKNGEKFFVSALISPIKNDDGKVISYFAIEEDISLLKYQKEKIDKYQKLLKGFGFALQNLLTIKDYEISLYETLKQLGESVGADRAYIFENYYDSTSNELFARQIYEWVDEGIIPQINNPLLQKLNYNKYGFDLSKTLSQYVRIFDRKNINKEFRELMELQNVKSFAVVSIIVNEKFWGFIGFDNCREEFDWGEEEKSILKAASISIGKAMERELTKTELIFAKNEAQKADKLKTEFLAQISHEIRSPLNIILNYLSLLKEMFIENPDPDIADMFSGINNAGNRIIRTIDLILNLAELQTNSYDSQPKKLDLIDDVLRMLIYEYKNNALKKNLTLDFIQLTQDTFVFVDEYSITQVFANLLDNAIKYTDDGSISVTVRKDEINHLIVEIKDSGIGISEEYLPNLFQPFRQEEQGYSRKYEGNGLGLSLVKRYCDLNNARISVESKKGKGTIFSVVFN